MHIPSRSQSNFLPSELFAREVPRSMIARFGGLFKSDRRASEISAVIRVIMILYSVMASVQS